MADTAIIPAISPSDKNSNATSHDLSLTKRRRSSNSLSKLRIPDPDGLMQDRSLSCPIDRPTGRERGRSDDIVEEGRELFQHFVKDEIAREGLQAPQECFTPLEDPRTPDGYSKSVWSRTGKDLRLMADEFAKTKEREAVRRRANEVSLLKLTYEKFADLLSQLFHQGTVTKERIMVLFYFCSDLAIRSLREKAIILFKTLLQWSLSYITEQVCAWVQEQGGWGVVVVDGSKQLFQKVLLAVGILMVCYGVYKYIKKSL